MSKRRIVEAHDSISLTVTLDLKTVIEAAKAVRQENWDLKAARAWAKEARGFLDRAHQSNLADVVKVVMGYMHKHGGGTIGERKSELTLPKRSRRGLWKPGE